MTLPYFNKNTKLNNNSTIRGFSLIELIVAVAVMLVVIGGGMAAFIKFNDRQNVSTSAKELQTMLRAAQVKAKVGEDAEVCRTVYSPSRSLRGYRVYAQKNTSEVILQTVCSVGKFGLKDYIERDKITFENTVSVRMIPDDDLEIEFLSLIGGVDGAGTIEIQGSGLTYSFQVSAGGEISEGSF